MVQFCPDPLQALDGKHSRLAPVRRPIAGPPLRTNERRTPSPAHSTAQVPGDERLVERLPMHHPQPRRHIPAFEKEPQLRTFRRFAEEDRRWLQGSRRDGTAISRTGHKVRYQ